MIPSSWIVSVNYSSRSCSSTATTFKRVFYFGFISRFCHQNWDGNSEEDKTESTVKTEQIIFPSHIIYLTEGSKRKAEKGEKTGKISACPPIFHSLRAHPSWVHLLIWSCHRLGNRDLQPLETNDLAREGQQLTAGGATPHSCRDLLCIKGVGLKHLGFLVFKIIYLMIQDKLYG